MVSCAKCRCSYKRVIYLKAASIWSSSACTPQPLRRLSPDAPRQSAARTSSASPRSRTHNAFSEFSIHRGLFSFSQGVSSQRQSETALVRSSNSFFYEVTGARWPDLSPTQSAPPSQPATGRCHARCHTFGSRPEPHPRPSVPDARLPGDR